MFKDWFNLVSFVICYYMDEIDLKNIIVLIVWDFEIEGNFEGIIEE